MVFTGGKITGKIEGILYKAQKLKELLENTSRGITMDTPLNEVSNEAVAAKCR